MKLYWRRTLVQYNLFNSDNHPALSPPLYIVERGGSRSETG